MTLELAGGIALQVNGPHAERFVELFNEVFAIAFTTAEQQTIIENLEYVRWTTEAGPNCTAYVARENDSTPKSHAYFYARRLAGLSDRFWRWMIAHELMHVLQFATGVYYIQQTLLLCQLVASEVQANSRAEKFYGPRPYSDLLAKKGLPTDDDFDRLANEWQYLTEDQRLEVRALSSAFAYEAKAAHREAG